MKVLFVTNSSTQRCGVRLYGELWMQALRAAGVEVVEWDGTYSTIYHRGSYLPPDAEAYDLIHLNWDPAATNHFLPEHFPAEVPLSVFLHDVPPHSTCPVAGRADLLLAHEPGEGIVVIDHAVPDYQPPLWSPKPSHRVVIGTAGIRNDPGVELVDQVCRAHGWHHSRAGESGWLTTEQEIDRLARCTVNVAWYATSGRGKSMGAMFMVAAQRPLILSGSSMFSALWPYADQMYTATQTHRRAGHPQWTLTPRYQTDLKALLAVVLHAVEEGHPIIPVDAARQLAWSRLAPRIATLWRGVCP